MIILDGKAHAKAIIENISVNLKKYKHAKPCLTQISIGSPPEAISYIKHVEKKCHLIGFESNHIVLPDSSDNEKVIELINTLNHDQNVHGIILHMPIPAHLDHQKIAMHINPLKDIDGTHPFNMGLLCLGKPSLIPATPLAIMKILNAYHIPLKGKNAVVIGRSNIVGKPISLMLLSKDCTVTIMHSKTINIEKEASRADILIAAIGKPEYITPSYVKKDAVVIDVGINYKNNKLVGDVDFDNVAPISSHITPVPGGIGSMTTAVLLENLLTAFVKQQCP